MSRADRTALHVVKNPHTANPQNLIPGLNDNKDVRLARLSQRLSIKIPDDLPVIEMRFLRSQDLIILVAFSGN